MKKKVYKEEKKTNPEILKIADAVLNKYFKAFKELASNCI